MNTKIDPEVLRLCMAAGLTRAQVERLYELEIEFHREGRPGYGDARRAGALRAQMTRPALRSTPARTVPTLAAVRGRVAAAAAAFWGRA